MKYTCVLDIAKNGTSYKDKIVLKSGPSEVSWHIALKILGYVLFIEQHPGIEESVGRRFKPDLVRLDETGDIALWIDCGNIAVHKIDRVALWVGKPGIFYILRRNRREAEMLLPSIRGKVSHPERVGVMYFDDGVVNAFAEQLDANNRLTGRVSPERLDLELDNRHGRSELHSRVPLTIA